MSIRSNNNDAINNDDEAQTEQLNADAGAGGNRLAAEQLHHTDEDDDDGKADDWIDPSPRPRRKDDTKEAKKKKKKKKKKKEAKKTSFFGAGEGLGVVVEGPNSGDEGDGVGRDQLLRAPSVDYLPRPPEAFSLNPESGDEEKKREMKALQIDDMHARPSRPGVMRVRVDDDGDVEIGGGPSITDLVSNEFSNRELLSGGEDDDLPRSPSSGDIMARAELVNDNDFRVIAAAAPDRTDELQDRVKMLEEDKAQREGQGDNDKARKRILCFFALFLVIAGATIGIIVSLVGGNSPAPTEAPSRSPTPQPSPHPTLFPTAFPTQFPTPLPTVDVEELWTALIQSKSPATTFDNTTSPEYRALEWMVEDPLTKSLFNDTSRVLQRFVLALFWYATGASLGGGWLTDTDECTWGGTSLRCDFNDTLVGMSFVRLGLSGTIPKELGLLSALTHLGLDGNDAFEGTIPSEIGQLTALTLLDLTYTGLEGSLPSEIGLLTVLETIYLGQTSVGGTLPTEVGMMSLMDFFAVYDNKVNGTIPSELGLLTAVTLLDISENALIGTIPSEVANLTNMESFQIYGNQNITGTMPSNLCSSSTELSIDCGSAIECTCCSGPWPNFEPCEDPSDVFGGA